MVELAAGVVEFVLVVVAEHQELQSRSAKSQGPVGVYWLPVALA